MTGNTIKSISCRFYTMEESHLYKVAQVCRNEFYNTKPDYIEEADLFPIVHDNTEGIISGNIEVFLNTGSAYASYNVVEISRNYTDEQSCEKTKEEVISYLLNYFEKIFCAAEIKSIWKYVESGDLKWHPYTKYTIPCSSYKKDIYGLYDTIKMYEIAISLIKPKDIKKVKLIPYFIDLGQDNDDDTTTLLINIDVNIEKKNKCTQFTWSSTADGYDTEKSKEKAEDSLIYEMGWLLRWDLEHGEIESFWEDLPWNKFDWKPIL